MTLIRKPLTDFTADEAVAAFNAGFAGYVVPVAMTVPVYEARMRAENLDPSASHLWLQDDAPAAILLVARRGWGARIAALGVAPRSRGLGLGRQATGLAIDEARARGDRTLELEVIASNTPAVALYAAMGFAGAGGLYGFALGDGAAAGALEALDPAEAARIAGSFAAADLPWQLQPATLGAKTRPAVGLTDAGRRIVALVEGTRMTGLALSAEVTGEEAAAFSAALRAQVPGLTCPAIFPGDHRSRFFLPGGWSQTAMEQRRLRIGF